VTKTGRYLRGVRLDRNPLRRAADRAETLVLMLLAVLFLAGAPLAALAAGAWGHAAAQRAELAQQASRYQVTATIVRAPGAPAAGSGDIMGESLASWTAPDGTAVSDQVGVSAGTRVGATATVWTTRSGQLVSRPMNDSQVASLADLAGVTGVAALAVALAASGVLIRWWLNKRRMAGWDADWRVTGPRWTTRR
jgi:hypothetical protein